MIDPIEEKLKKLNAEFSALLGDSQLKTEDNENRDFEKLIRCGLTKNEAKAWLKHEPNFSSDVSYHEPRNRRKVTRTTPSLI